MSLSYEENIATFINLLDNQPSLFSPANLDELEQLIASLPDDIEKISEAISLWYEQQPKIIDAQLQLLNESNSPNSLITKVKAPGKDKGNVPESDPNINKETLENAIKRSSNYIDNSSYCNQDKEQIN